MIDQDYETVLRSFPKKIQRELEAPQMESYNSSDKFQYYHMPEKINYFFFTGDVEPVFTGVTLHPMFSSPRYLEREKEAIQILAKQHDIHLTFEPHQTFDFYTVPHVEVFAKDNHGGHLVSKESGFSFDSEEPVYYISRDKQCYLAASSGKELLQKGIHWKDAMMETQDIEIFNSRQMAESKYEILDIKYT